MAKRKVRFKDDDRPRKKKRRRERDDDRDDRDEDRPQRGRGELVRSNPDDYGLADIVNQQVQNALQNALQNAFGGMSGQGYVPGRVVNGQESPGLQFDRPPPTIRRMRLGPDGRPQHMDVEIDDWPPKGEKF